MIYKTQYIVKIALIIIKESSIYNDNKCLIKVFDE